MSIETKRINIFIGSSSEGKEIAENVAAQLRDDKLGWYPHMWDRGVFELSVSGFQSLIAATKENDFAILVLTPDDRTEVRQEVRSTPRDNVIFELGLFTGAIGEQRTIAVQCQSPTIKLPTDLLGITTAIYDPIVDGDVRSAINRAILPIRDHIRKHGPRQNTIPTPAALIPESLHTQQSLTRDLIDLLREAALRRAGFTSQVNSEKDFRRWSRILLYKLRIRFRARQQDAYIVWLRPNANSRLQAYVHDNLRGVQEHYDFGLGEGLAGTVWETGIPAVHTAHDPNPSWETRPGCENTAYVCVPVGERGGKGGVLSVGSDSGFEVDREQDIKLLEPV